MSRKGRLKVVVTDYIETDLEWERGEMARRGFTHAEILRHYYGKAQLKNLGY